MSTSACPAGWGVAVVADRASAPRCVAELFGPVVLDAGSPFFLGAEVGSNNTGELSGVCEALLWLLSPEADAHAASPAVICYDSQYAAFQVQGKWTTNKNKALVEKGQALLELSIGPSKPGPLRKALGAFSTAVGAVLNRFGLGEPPLQTELTTSLTPFVELRKKRDKLYGEPWPDPREFEATIAEVERSVAA